VSSAEAKIPLEKGKISKVQKSSKLDPGLRNAIAAVLSKGTIGNDSRVAQGSGYSPEAELPDVLHSHGISVCKTDFEMPSPNPEAPLGGVLGDQAGSSEAPHSSDGDKKELVDPEQKLQEILQAIQEAGYVIKKDNKSVGLNPSTDQPGPGSSKKREVVTCGTCSKFSGRPCELKYAIPNTLGQA
jgi:hypothetical protein